MKVQNTSIFMGNNDGSLKGVSQRTDQKSSGSFYGANLNDALDPVAQKRQQAREQAMKIVGDAWEGEQKLDADLESRRTRIRELTAEIGEYRKEIKWFDEERTRLQKVYGVSADSTEQKDLELLEKELDAKLPGKNVSLSKEDRDRIAEIKANGLTEYQSRSLELKELSMDYERKIENLNQEIEIENSIISATKIERLKSSPMVKAQKQAEEVLEAASQEIIGMVLEEAKDHVDEELQEKVEAAKEQEEKKEILEERLEKIKEKKEQQEELTEEIIDASEQLLQVDNMQTEVQKEVQEVLDKMKLLAEDIKGAKVDETV